MKLSVNDTVITPELAEINEDHPLSNLFDITEDDKISTVVAIFERDWATEAKGYTKRVETSEHPDAYVYLNGSCRKFRLSELTKA